MNYWGMQNIDAKPVINVRRKQLGNKFGDCTPGIARNILVTADIDAVPDDELALLEALGDHASVAEKESVTAMKKNAKKF
jgi:hypothetical protein